MGLTSEIITNTPNEGRHLTGRPITGIIKYQLDKDTEFKKISLSLLEIGYCSWFESEIIYNANPANNGVHRIKMGNRYKFEGNEKNVVSKIYLGNKETEDNFTLSAGSYEEPFEMELPETMPASIKTDIGHIKYYLILKFKKPGFFSFDKKFKTKIEIFPTVDLTMTDASLTFGLDKTLMKLMSSKKHEINLKAQLDRGYFTSSGERRISFVVTNNSDAVVSVKTELISEIKYHDDTLRRLGIDNPKIKNKVIDECTVVTPSVPDNSVADMFNMIPMLPELYTVRHSKIISREYMLRVTLKLPMPHVNASVDVPIFIGERIDEARDEEMAEGERKTTEEPPPYLETQEECKE